MALPNIQQKAKAFNSEFPTTRINKEAEKRKGKQTTPRPLLQSAAVNLSQFPVLQTPHSPSPIVVWFGCPG